jgi:hypothetical protein
MSTYTIGTENWNILIDAVETVFKAKSTDVRKLEQILKSSKINEVFFRAIEERVEQPPRPVQPYFELDNLSTTSTKKSGSLAGFVESLCDSDSDGAASAPISCEHKKRPDNLAPFKNFLTKNRDRFAVCASQEFPSLSGKEREAKIKELAKQCYSGLSKEEKAKYRSL